MNTRAAQSQTSGSINRLFLNESPGLSLPVDRSRRYTRILLIVFLCTLPLVNPIVHADGVDHGREFKDAVVEVFAAKCSTAGALASTVHEEEAQKEMSGPRFNLRVGLFG